MIWLASQIGLCLLIAAIAGWYLGWATRADRSRDREADMREALAATTEIKDRELHDTLRRVTALEARLAQLGDDKREVEERRDELERLLAERAQVAPATELRDPQPPREDLERARAAIAAELESVRVELRAKAATIARLETRIAELEPRAEEAGELASRLDAFERAARSEQTTASAHQSEMDRLGKEVETLRARLTVADTRANDAIRERDDARARSESARARLEAILADRAADARTQRRLETELGEVKHALARQIERNRKQEVVHRSVVENLQAALQAIPAPAPQSPAVQNGKQEQAREDDLKEIPGIGPVFSARLRALGIRRFEQIARWQPSDIQLVADRLGVHRNRIDREGWIDAARARVERSSGPS